VAGSPVQDELLGDIARARDGDDEAFGRLVAATHADVFTLAFRLTGNRHDAADVVQETYLRAYRSFGKFRGDAKLSTWLHRITLNCASDLLGGRSRHHHEELEHDDVPEARDGHHPESSVDNGELRADLLDALDQLPGGLRAVVVLRDVYDLPHAEIGEHLGISSTAAKVRLHRARTKLRSAIEESARSDETDELMPSVTPEGLRDAV